MAVFNEKYVSSLAVGGGDGSIGNPWTFQEAFGGGVVNAYDRVNVKADGTYTLLASLVLSVLGRPFIFRGYKDVIGDGFQGWRPNGSLITSHMPVINTDTFQLRITANGIRHFFQSLNITGNVSAGVSRPSLLEIGTNINSQGGIVQCKFYNSAAGGQCISIDTTTGYYTTVVCCECLSDGINIFTDGQWPCVIGCSLQSISSNAIYAGLHVGNLIHDCGANAVDYQFHSVANSIVNCAGGYFIGSARTHAAIIGNIITGTGRALNRGDARVGTNLFRNRKRDNTSADNMYDYPDVLEVTKDLGGDEQDYVDATNDDYRPIPGSPAARSGPFDWSDLGALRSMDLSNSAKASAAPGKA